MSEGLKEVMEQVFFDPLTRPEWLTIILKNSGIGEQFQVTREQADWILTSIKYFEENLNDLNNIQKNNLQILFRTFDSYEYYLRLLGVHTPSY